MKKKIVRQILLFALLISSAIFYPLISVARSGTGGDDNGDGGNPGYSQIRFDSSSKTMTISTGLSVGSTAANRIRSIGWFVTITLPDGQTASAVFEQNGSSGVTG